jgi:hypothetical protein
MGNAQFMCAQKTWDEKPRAEMLPQDPNMIKAIVCTLNYTEEYAADSGAGQLTCDKDGSRFLDLCLQGGVPEENIFHMTDTPENCGTEFWPNKANLAKAFKTKAKEIKAMGPDAMFVFFFAGHGYHQDETGCIGRDEEDGQDEFLCLMQDTGFALGSQIDPMLDDDMKSIIYSYFPRTNKMLFVTDCCHSGTVCDLDDPVLGGHQIVHYAAVQDNQEAQDVGGGAFTSSMLEMIEDLVQQGCQEMSVDELYTSINTKFGPGWELTGAQNFNYNATMSADPSTFPWPFFPAGYNVATVIDTDKRFA